MSVSLLPSSLYAHLRSLVHAVAVRSSVNASVGSAERVELGSLTRSYGHPCRMQILQLCITEIEQHQIQQQQTSKACEQIVAEETTDLQKREPFKWSVILARVLESTIDSSSPASPRDDTLLTRFASYSGLNLRQTLALAIQLHRSPIQRLQHASITFLTQTLAWTSLGSITQDNPNWSQMNEELLHDLSYIVTSHAAFPIEHKQSILQALAKLTPSDAKRENRVREESADLVASISAHTNTGSVVADLLRDLGYSISSTIESFKEALHPFTKLTEQDVASIIIMILRTQYARLHAEEDASSAAAAALVAPSSTTSKGGKNNKLNSKSPTPQREVHSEGWQINHVIDAIKEHTQSSSGSSTASKLNWKNILENEIDQKTFYIYDEKTYLLYIDIYRYATSTTTTSSAATFHMPIDFMLREWKNSTGQLSLVRWALPSSLTLFSYLPPTNQTNAYAARNSKSILAAANNSSSASSDVNTDAADIDASTTVMSLTSTGVPAAVGKVELTNGTSRYQSWVSVDLLESLLESIPSSSYAAASVTPSSASSSAQSLYASLRSLLSVALDRSPELLTTGLLSVRTNLKSKSSWHAVKDELITCMLPAHVAIAPHASVAQSFQKIWEAGINNSSSSASPSSKAAIFWIMKYWLSATPTTSSSATNGLLPPLLVSLGYSLKSFLETLLQSASTPFVVDLSTTNGPPSALVNTNLTFAKWCLMKYQTEYTSNTSSSSIGKEIFLSNIFAYIKEAMSDSSSSSAADIGLPPFRLSTETVAILFKTLLSLPNAPSQLMSEMQNYFASNATQYVQFQAGFINTIGSQILLSGGANSSVNGLASSNLHQSMNNLSLGGVNSSMNAFNQSSDASLVPNMQSGVGTTAAAGANGVSDEIDEEAISYVQKIYNGTMSVEQVIEMLLRFKVSSSKRERDVCQCMIHNLFDEYKYFHRYPVKILQITGYLFGSLIAHKLVTGFTLGIALRFILEALRKGPETKLFSFGIWSITQFRSRLSAWPQYAMLILHIPTLQAVQPDLYNGLTTIVQTHQQQGTMNSINASGEEVDFSTTGSSAFSVGFHSDAQSFTNFASFREAERAADLAAANAKVAAGGENTSQATSHLPPGLGLKSTGTPGPALAASLIGAGGNATNPAGPIGGARGTVGTTAASATTPTAHAGAASFGSTPNIDSLLSAEGDAPLPLAPSEGLKDKIHFIINCLSFGSGQTRSNLRQKGRELKLILRAEYLPYFSRYLVIKRVSIEANFHRLYAAFLDYVGIPELRKIMLETTYYNIQVLLRNDKIVSSSSERSLLKNLGSWLGLLTIAKNKPIRSKYLELKTLILEAYDTGRLIAVIPFCAKVLESCAESRVFKPPNPWLMAVVGLLREIFDLPGLKLNLKFEIEVLFLHLSLQMKEVRSTNLLKHRPLHLRDIRMEREEKQRAGAGAATPTNAQAAANSTSMSRTPFPLLPTPNPLPPLPKTGVAPLKPGALGLGLGLGGLAARSPSPNMSEEDALRMGLNTGGSNAFGPPAGTGTTTSTALTAGNVDSSLIPNLSQYVVINSTIALFQMYPALKRCVPTAIDRAIREIINPVVERSLAIACVTTRELILKDFCLTGDHEVLVRERGWTPLPQVRAGEHVWSLSKYGDETSEWSKVEETVVQRAGPIMHRFESPELHLLTTPNHSNWVRQSKGTEKAIGAWMMESSAELGAERYFIQGAPNLNRNAYAFNEYSFLSADVATDSIKQLAWCTLIGCFLANGRLAINGETKSVILTASNIVGGCLNALSWCDGTIDPYFLRTSSGYESNCAELYDFFSPMIDQYTISADAVNVPQRFAKLNKRQLDYSWRYSLSVQQARAIVAGLASSTVLSEKASSDKQLRVASSSSSLHDECFTLAALAGWSCSLDDSKSLVSFHTSYDPAAPIEAVYARLSKSTHHTTVASVDELAYCLKVTSGNFLVRRHAEGEPMHLTYTGNCMEPDETKMRLASNSMVSNLTSSLALVTCREPLRVSITNHLNQLLEANTNPTERHLVERACMQVSADNLELGTTLIEKEAAARAIREIDEQLAPVYQMRRKHRESTGQGYIDISYQYGNRYPAALPEALRAKPGVGLQQSQLRVYEDFKTIRSQHAAAAAAAPQTGSERPLGKEGAATGVAATTTPPTSTSTLLQDEKNKSVVSSNAFAAPARPGSALAPPTSTLVGTAAPSNVPSTRSPPLGAQAQQQASNLTAQQTLDKLLGYLATLEQAVLRFPNHKSIPLHSLTSAVAGVAAGAAGAAAAAAGQREDQEINVLMRLMAALLQQTSRDEANYPKDLVPLTFALKVFKRLYERENRSSLLQIDVHIGVLKCIRAVCPKLLPELTAWLLYADDDRKFILPITAGLLRARLLNTSELDAFLSKLASTIFASGQAVAPSPQPNPAAPAGTAAPLQQVLHPQFEFILTLVRRVVVKRPIVSVGELGQLLETLNKIGQQASQQRTKLLADHIAHLLEDVRTAAVLAEKERAAGEGLDKSLVGIESSSVLPPLSLLESDDAASGGSESLLPDEPEPAGLRQQVMYLLDEWTNICLQQGQANDKDSYKAHSAYLGVLQQQRLLATPEATQKFFRVIIQLCIESSGIPHTPAQHSDLPNVPYVAIDALAKLFVFLLKWTNLGGFSTEKFDAPNIQTQGQTPTPNQTASKIQLLRSFLSAAVYVLKKDQQQKSLNGTTTGTTSPPASSSTFNQRPYLRLFTNLLQDLNTPDPLLDSNNVEVLAAFASHFRALRPQACPGFLFAWLELISHRMFMSKLLISKTPGCAALFARLLVELFRFLQPYLRQADLTEVLRLAYKGTLRLLLVLLHDFPEFLCEFHFSFCDVIPTSCIQMRNLILSAFPRSMRLPDPFTPNLKVDLLQEMTQSPRIHSDFAGLLQQPQHRHTTLAPLDHYLRHRQPPSTDAATFFKQLIDSLTLRSAILHTPPPAGSPAPTPQQLEIAHNTAVKRAGTTYNVPLINSVVMFTGLAGISSLLANSGKSAVSQFQDSSSMDVYESLLSGLDAEGRYYVLNAIANQLRFPNNHTHYFSCVLLYLFLQCKDDVLMEQMTRVLLERLIVHRPHPWGLLITFIELIKNPRYDFWRQPFTRCAPEIERLFESVCGSVLVKQAAGGAGGATTGTGQPATNGSALGSSVGSGASAATQAMLLLNNDTNHA